MAVEKKTKIKKTTPEELPNNDQSWKLTMEKATPEKLPKN